MVKPASSSRLLGSLIILALLLGSTTVSAQQAAQPDDSDKPESEEAVFVPIEYRAPPWQVSVGVRLAGKAKVKFSQLGAMANTNIISGNIGPDPTATAAEKDTADYKKAIAKAKAGGRIYDDGSVLPDQTYIIVPLNGNTLYKIDPGDAKTNYWGYTSADQIVDRPEGKSMAFHAYSIESTGGQTSVEQNSGLAWDVEVSRELGSSKRMSWGLLFGAAISDIRAKTGMTVKANLRTITDYYLLGGVTPTDTAYIGREQRYLQEVYYADTDTSHKTPLGKTDANGKPVYVKDAQGNNIIYWTPYGRYYDPKEIIYSYDPARLPTDPYSRTNTTQEVDCIGYWEVKGAYMTARFGPYFNYQLTRRLAVKASAGLTFTVIGATLRINERVYVPALKDYMWLNNEKENLDATVSGILGYFASCELDAYFTDRTGLFIGASHESFQRDLNMTYGLQQADVDLTAGTVLRTGITTRF